LTKTYHLLLFTINHHRYALESESQFQGITIHGNSALCRQLEVQVPNLHGLQCKWRRQVNQL